MAHLKGKDVNVFIKPAPGGGYSAVVKAISCDINLTSKSLDASSKSDANIEWEHLDSDGYEWSMSTESYLTSADQYKNFLSLMLQKTQFPVAFNAANANIWKGGNALLTSMSVQADADGYIKLSLTFTGVSALSDAPGTAPSYTLNTTALRGKTLMLGVYGSDTKWHSIAMSTSHTFNITANVEDVSTKDSMYLWPEKEVTGFSGEITTDNLLATSDYSESALMLFDFIGKVQTFADVKVSMAYCPAALTDRADDWQSMTPIFTSIAKCTDIKANGGVKDNATFQATFKLTAAPDTTVVSTQSED